MNKTIYCKSCLKHRSPEGSITKLVGNQKRFICASCRESIKKAKTL